MAAVAAADVATIAGNNYLSLQGRGARAALRTMLSRPVRPESCILSKVGSDLNNTKLQFILTGFTQESGFRVFAFTSVQAGATRVNFTVRAEMSLVQRYSIPMQELPLLCRSLLERREEADAERSFTFTEEEMMVYSKDLAATRLAAAAKRRPPRKPAAENLGAAWRGPQQPPQ